MTLAHECGHIVGGMISGASLTDFDLAPWRMPYSLHAPDPYPLVTLWAGPLFGVTLPLIAAAIIRQRWAWFIADFCCLIANGGYLALAVDLRGSSARHAAFAGSRGASRMDRSVLRSVNRVRLQLVPIGLHPLSGSSNGVRRTIRRDGGNIEHIAVDNSPLPPNER